MNDQPESFDHKRREDGKLYLADLSWDETKELSGANEDWRNFSRLSNQLWLLLALNRTARRNVGVYLVLHDPWSDEQLPYQLQLPDELLGVGLIGSRDRCWIASREKDQLRALVERTVPRTAWMLDFDELEQASKVGLAELLDSAKPCAQGIAIVLPEGPVSISAFRRVASRRTSQIDPRGTPLFGGWCPMELVRLA